MTSSLGSTSPTNNGHTYRGPFAIMTVLFFMWGFMTMFNDILIPRFKEAFTLDYFRAMLVQFAFFGAYFIGSLAYFIISATTTDPIARMGYKNGVVIGLLISATGSALFWPAAATMLSYPLFLAGLFIVGLGFAILQIAANPYVTILGPERKASSRLNLAQAFNSLGTTIGPLIGGYLIFQYFAKTGVHGADSVKVPCLAFCIVFVLLAVVFFCIRLPHVGEGKIERGIGALKYPHVQLGVLAVFMYVGGEVAIGSTLISFLGQSSVAGLNTVEASKYVSLFWGGMLIVRFKGAVELSEMKKVNKKLALVAIPIAGLLLFWILRSWNSDTHQFDFAGGGSIVKNYLPLLGLCWVLFQFDKAFAGPTLLIFGTTIVILLAISMFQGGKLAMWCIVSIGLFTSIGWPNIFSLALDRMGVYKSQVSSLLVMAILGGALLPPIQGFIADHHGLQISFIVPLLAYACVAFYVWKGHEIGRKKLS
ncbi:MAG TPA: sugar MFS transporter [Verrucomicrobiae bacterium]|nr:sugar MFS transporter [Verrucomicrobiae bacterium]